MLKVIPGTETVKHLCEGMTVGGQLITFDRPRNLGEKDSVEVLMHDIHPYIFIVKTNQKIPITYCPYCGVEVEKEERP